MAISVQFETFRSDKQPSDDEWGESPAKNAIR